MVETPGNLPDFVNWPSFPFTGDMRLKPLLPKAGKEPPRQGEDPATCHACAAPDEAYIWVSERWRVRAMERPTGLPMVLILESRSHLDLGDLPNLLAAELGVMTVRLERAIRSLDGVARVHVNRWGDGSAHLHLWFLARPFGYLQLRGSFLSLWDDILPPIAEETWRENLALIAAWLAEFGGRPLAEPPRIDWQAPASVAAVQAAQSAVGTEAAQGGAAGPSQPTSTAAPAPANTAAGATQTAAPAAPAQSAPAQSAPAQGTPAQGAPAQGAAGGAQGQSVADAAAQSAASGAPADSEDASAPAAEDASAAPSQTTEDAEPPAATGGAPVEGGTAVSAATGATANAPATQAKANNNAAPSAATGPASGATGPAPGEPRSADAAATRPAGVVPPNAN